VRQGQAIDTKNQQVGQALRDARLGAGLTQQELATRLGWSPDTLASYETGRRGLRAAQLAEVARALNIPTAALFLAAPQAAAVLRSLGDSPERWAQVALFLEALDG
jgi:transcriptional regulator with XRE-family HTH domain